MTISTIRAIGLALALGSPMSALAADTDGRFALRSLGTLTCGQVVESVNALKGEELQSLVDQLSFWLGGYLTHANRVTPETFDIVPFAVERDVLAVIVNRCQTVPADTSFEAVTSEVVTGLSTLAVKGQSPVRSSEMMIPLRQSVVVQAQEKLIALGHLTGKADGEFGENTKKAVQAFQTSVELAATGKLDIDTVLVLLSQ
jgi:hypothetical protein